MSFGFDYLLLAARHRLGDVLRWCCNTIASTGRESTRRSWRRLHRMLVTRRCPGTSVYPKARLGCRASQWSTSLKLHRSTNPTSTLCRGECRGADLPKFGKVSAWCSNRTGENGERDVCNESAESRRSGSGSRSSRTTRYIRPVRPLHISPPLITCRRENPNETSQAGGRWRRRDIPLPGELGQRRQIPRRSLPPFPCSCPRRNEGDCPRWGLSPFPSKVFESGHRRRLSICFTCFRAVGRGTPSFPWSASASEGS